MDDHAATPDAHERVLAAATDLFAERGFAATATRAIAERADVNEVTIFRHFGNKAGVLRALCERIALTSAGIVIAAAIDPADTRGTLEALARTEVRSAIRNGGLALRLAFDATSAPEVADLMNQSSAANLADLTAYLASRQGAGDLRADVDPAMLAEMFFAMTSSLIMGRILMGTATAPPHDAALDRLVTQLVDVYWSGSGTRAARTPTS
jgi:AcrR family transcriptional regulator